ncbi:FAD-dependent oxidoreductase [Candidatus Woesearchaeota archaeon]|nr:FAD-dependent oxidoreductase [Candidatus Woesearchaeota archaeon]
MTKIVIIGLGAAGFAAALAIKKTDRKAEILFIDKKDYDLMHPCGLPYALEGKIPLDNLKHSIGAERMKIDVKHESEVTILDTKKKEAITSKGDKINYDKLIIATGSSAFAPPVEGIENCFVVDCPENVERLEKAAKKAKRAVVVGAGAIGVETAWALKERGLAVTIVDMLPTTFPKTIDQDMSAILEEYLKNNNIDFNLGKKLEKIEKDKVRIEGEEIPAELIVMATGVRANMKIAEKAGIKCSKFGIIVNEKMETSAKDVYAAGDCVEGVNIINKKPYVCQIASAAYKQGRVAGINTAGGKAVYPGATGTFVSVIGEIEVAATGFNSFFAEQNGYNVIVGKVKGSTLPDWMPGGKEVTVKLLADKKTKKVIGGQVVGSGAFARINVISTAIKAGFTLQQLLDTELAYCPAVSQVQDVLTLAAELGLRKLK